MVIISLIPVTLRELRFQGSSKKERSRAMYDFINGKIGKDSQFGSLFKWIDPKKDPNLIPLEDIMYIFFCFNEEWKMAEIMR